MSYTYVEQDVTENTVTTYGVPALSIAFDDIDCAERYLKAIENNSLNHESFFVQTQELRHAITRYYTNPAE